VTTIVLGNHESISRGTDRLVGRILSHIKNNSGLKPLLLSSPDSVRDWGYAEEYINFIFQKPDDFNDAMLVTGFSWSVRDLVDAFINAVGQDKLMVTWDESEVIDVNENKRNRYLITEKQREYLWFPKYYGNNLVARLIEDLYEPPKK
jgi:GDP-D-mannose dehydratase